MCITVDNQENKLIDNGLPHKAVLAGILHILLIRYKVVQVKTFFMKCINGLRNNFLGISFYSYGQHRCVTHFNWQNKNHH
jgi:hypothetical protein